MDLKFRDIFFRIGRLVDVHPEKLQDFLPDPVAFLRSVRKEPGNCNCVVIVISAVAVGEVKSFRKDIKAILRNDEYTFILPELPAFCRIHRDQRADMIASDNVKIDLIAASSECPSLHLFDILSREHGRIGREAGSL